MILLLFGSDPLAIRRRLRELREEAGDASGMLASNITTFEARDLKPGELLAAARAAPFLGERRIVEVDGLLDRFEGDRRSSTPSIKPLDPLFDGLAEGLPESTMLIFKGGAINAARNPVATRLKKLPGTVFEEHKGPDARDLTRFVENEASARGLAFERGASRALAERLTGDTIAMAAEIDKLALYAMGRRATVADVEAVVSSDPESRIFDFTDAVLDGDAVRAYRSARILLRGSETIDSIIAMLVPALRTVAEVVDMLDEGRTPEEIGVAIKRDRYPRLRDQAIKRGRRLGFDGIRNAYAVVAGVDRARKRGELDEDAALDVLVGRLVRG